MRLNDMRDLQLQLEKHFQQLVAVQKELRELLIAHADGKVLKGNELVGWLGEIYIKNIFGGKLVGDDLEHDVLTPEGWRVSVKTRKGSGSGWRQSSAIPKIEGMDCPTHLAFVHLDDSYLVRKIWLHEWKDLFEKGRFHEHIVRGEFRSYVFRVNEKLDRERVIYDVVERAG